MIDIEIIETGNGGDMRLITGDVSVVAGYENMPYLAMFGGDGWWANDLLLDAESFKFLSQTEKALQNNPLTSAGRIAIENAVKADLKFIKDNLPDTDITYTVTIPGIDRVEIYIKIDGKEFYYEWNPSTGFLNYRV